MTTFQDEHASATGTLTTSQGTPSMNRWAYDMLVEVGLSRKGLPNA